MDEYPFQEDDITIQDPFSEGRDRRQPPSSDLDCGIELPDPFATFLSKSSTCDERPPKSKRCRAKTATVSIDSSNLFSNFMDSDH